MSTLIDQLTQLQTALTKLRDKYQFASSELTRIKAQPTITADQLQAVQAEPVSYTHLTLPTKRIV